MTIVLPSRLYRISIKAFTTLFGLPICGNWCAANMLKINKFTTAVAFWGHVANVAISIFYYATTYPLPLRTVLLVRLLYCTCSTTGPMPLACCLVISFPYKRSASPSFNTFKECDINWRHLNDSDSTIDTLLFVRHCWPFLGKTNLGAKHDFEIWAFKVFFSLYTKNTPKNGF